MTWKNRDELEENQNAAIQRLLEEVIGRNQFYTRKLEGAGIFGPAISIEEFKEKVPFTTRKEWTEDQIAHPPYGSNLTYSVKQYTRYCQTSGSTGKPMKWLDTNASWAWMLDSWKRVYQAAGIEPGSKIYFAFSFGPFLGFWSAFEAAPRAGCMAIPGGGSSSIGRLGVMAENRVDVLCCTPTYAIHLGEVAQKEGVDTAAMGLKHIVVAGEPGGSIPATRKLIENLWPGAEVFDHHGMTEVGPVTYEAADGSGLIVMEEAYLAEVVDPESGDPIEEGGQGELVLTTLGRLGSPLIRYRTGDLVKPIIHEERMLLQGGILGRLDDMVIVRGVNVFPAAVESVVRGFSAVNEFQVRVHASGTLTEMSLQVEGNVDPKAVEKALNESLSLRIPVEVVADGALPRFEMKAKRWNYE
jgi:phenylacetate-CoA ligase